MAWAWDIIAHRSEIRKAEKAHTHLIFKLTIYFCFIWSKSQNFQSTIYCVCMLKAILCRIKLS